MYFIYKKQINVASEYSYDVNSIVEWFKDYIDKDDIIEAYGGVEEVTAKDIVDDIFCEILLKSIPFSKLQSTYVLLIMVIYQKNMIMLNL